MGGDLVVGSTSRLNKVYYQRQDTYTASVDGLFSQPTDRVITQSRPEHYQPTATDSRVTPVWDDGGLDDNRASRPYEVRKQSPSLLAAELLSSPCREEHPSSGMEEVICTTQYWKDAIIKELRKHK